MKKIEMKNVAEVELVYKTKVKAVDRYKITKSTEAFGVFKDNWNMNTIEYVEEFKLLLLNRANEVLGVLNASKGGISGTVTDVRVIFQAAIKANASGIIVAHNHPSGNIRPSEGDLKITRKIKEAGSILDIQLLDHLIISEDNYYSMGDERDM
jgi:DNA repair protein RadC